MRKMLLEIVATVGVFLTGVVFVIFPHHISSSVSFSFDRGWDHVKMDAARSGHRGSTTEPHIEHISVGRSHSAVREELWVFYIE